MPKPPAYAVLLALLLTASVLSITAPTASADPPPQTGTAAGGGQAHAGSGPGAGRALPNAAAGTAAAATTASAYGIDIASYQHPNGAAINWSSVAASGVRFAYIKATEGTSYVNQYYAGDARAAKTAGIYAGAYAFVRPDSANPVAQADKLLAVAPYVADGLTLPPMVDIEWPYVDGGSYVAPYPCWGLSAAAMVNWLRSFTGRLQSRTGVRPLIYTNNYWWNPCTASNTSFAGLPLTTAHYDGSPTPLPAGWGKWTFWQYSAALSVRGIVGGVDADVFNGSAAGLAGFAGGYWRLPATHPMTSDVSGDGKGDLLAVMPARSYALTSTGTAFQPLTLWSSVPFAGAEATLTADVTGDGKADLVAVNGVGSWAMRSSGTGFYPPVKWSPARFGGARALVAGDVDGDHRADLIAVNGTSVWVMRSTGSGFGPPTVWSTSTFAGVYATYPADVNGDGRSDLVAIDGTSTWVMLSTGSRFAAPVRWSRVAFLGGRATVTADVNGDHRADVIAVDGTNTWVMLSTGSGYAAPVCWSVAAFAGNKAMVAADLNGDGRADALSVNTTSTWALLSNGHGFGSPIQWTSY